MNGWEIEKGGTMMKGRFLSTSRYIAQEYLKGNHYAVKAIIKPLLRWDDESRGEFLHIGHDEYYLTPTGLEILAVNLIFNTCDDSGRIEIERLCRDLHQMGLMTDLYPFINESNPTLSEEP